MNFISKVPLYLKKKDATWVIVDHLTNSYFDSGTSYKKLWVRGYTLVPHFILRRMVNLNVYASALCFRIWRQLKNKYLQLTEFAYNNSFQSKIDFLIGEKISLKISSWKKVLQISRKGKLSLRFIRPYEIIE
ncbi:Retrotransposon protein, Ty3-gypsy subclass [Gossypium australe]|uniref:Retrotransposon protein, Ty3-gypsy subclass n=1 Tax=Gossypium australe TaxID=47621 RepID=A0A5B6VAC6_9ROSI|nr:Retrotransposon protein, Ty3-gypsy subclass [Gossypium australe]